VRAAAGRAQQHRPVLAALEQRQPLPLRVAQGPGGRWWRAWWVHRAPGALWVGGR
jgi:hypothetical protein